MEKKKYCVYIHMDNNDRCFYVGSGIAKYRPKNLVKRNLLWHAHYAEHGLSCIDIVAYFDTRTEALAFETERTLEMKALGEPLTNIKIGNEQLKGFSAPNFKSLILGLNENEELVVFNGQESMDQRQTKDGKQFFQKNIYECLAGRKNSHRGFQFFREPNYTELSKFKESAKFYDEESKELLIDYLSKFH